MIFDFSFTAQTITNDWGFVVVVGVSPGVIYVPTTDYRRLAH